MSTFSEIYFNGNQYNQMWLNGSKIWEKDTGGSGGIVYPYPDVDSVVTYRNTSSKSITKTFTVIDSSLPYSINGTNTTSYTFASGKETQVKLVNLKPYTNSTNRLYPTHIEQLRVPNLTDLSYLFAYIGYGHAFSISWQPQYFEFHSNPTNMAHMFDYCERLGDIMMEQFMPYFPNTSNVTDMSYMFCFCKQLKSLNLSNFDTSNVTNMGSMFHSCSQLTTLDLSSWDTSKVTSTTSSMFYSVKNCTIYIGDKWTLGTSSTFGGGSNLTFIKIVPIESIGELICSEDATNITSPSFTISTTIAPSNWTRDLEVIYDSNYLYTSDNFTFTLVSGCQGRSLDITYRSKKNPTISRTITITVSEDFEVPLEIDFTQPTAPTLPTWFTEEAKNSSYYFTHQKLCYNSSYYGLTHYTYFNTTYWTCYKLVAPTTGTLQFTYWAKCYSSSYPFTIHITTSATQPTYSSSTNRILNATNSTYATTDAIATMEVTQGETYYVHLQYKGNNTSSYGACIRSIELIPTE